MINDFLIMNITGDNDSIGLKIKNNFFIKKFTSDIKNYEALTYNILNFIILKDVNIGKNFSVLVNSGPGSFSSIRISIAVAKGIKISKECSLFSYNAADLVEFKLKNIELLIKNNLLENKLIKPVYIS
jgi:tRNA A37 threonylcarbamoyladenosine modification protein TsaB